MGGRRGQLVAGDAHPPAQPLVPGGRMASTAPALASSSAEVGHGVELVEVEPVAAEQAERLLQLGPHPVGVVAQGLAGHEEPVPDRGDRAARAAPGPGRTGAPRRGG